MTSINAQIVTSGVVTDCIVVDGAAALSNGGAALTWADGGESLTAPSGSMFMLQAGAGIGWTLSNGALVAPTPPAPPAPTQAQLLAYANAKQWALATGGYTITVNSAPLDFPTDVVSMGLITGKAARLAQPNPPGSFEWQTPTGFVTIAAADFIAVATQIADFVQSTFNALAGVFAAIEAGTTTTTAEIDSAAWPSNVSTTPA